MPKLVKILFIIFELHNFFVNCFAILPNTDAFFVIIEITTFSVAFMNFEGIAKLNMYYIKVFFSQE